MKALLPALLLLLGFGAQAALPCAQGEAGAHPMRVAVRADDAQTVVALDRAVHEQHCHCPAPAAVAQGAHSGPAKAARCAPPDDSLAGHAASLAELRRTHTASGRSDAGASPAPVVALYLLGARLRC